MLVNVNDGNDVFQVMQLAALNERAHGATEGGGKHHDAMVERTDTTLFHKIRSRRTKVVNVTFDTETSAMRNPSGLFQPRVTVSEEGRATFVRWPAFKGAAYEKFLDRIRRVGEVALRLIQRIEDLALQFADTAAHLFSFGYRL